MINSQLSKQYGFNLVTAIVHGDDTTRLLCDWLLTRSVWLAVEPLPDDCYMVLLKEENLKMFAQFEEMLREDGDLRPSVYVTEDRKPTLYLNFWPE
jgi:hypothetical protein